MLLEVLLLLLLEVVLTRVLLLLLLRAVGLDGGGRSLLSGRNVHGVIPSVAGPVRSCQNGHGLGRNPKQRGACAVRHALDKYDAECGIYRSTPEQRASSLASTMWTSTTTATTTKRGGCNHDQIRKLTCMYFVK